MGELSKHCIDNIFVLNPVCVIKDDVIIDGANNMSYAFEHIGNNKKLKLIIVQ